MGLLMGLLGSGPGSQSKIIKSKINNKINKEKNKNKNGKGQYTHKNKITGHTINWHDILKYDRHQT